MYDLAIPDENLYDEYPLYKALCLFGSSVALKIWELAMDATGLQGLQALKEWENKSV